MPGSDGPPGWGGAAGTVVESIDPRAQAFAGVIHVSNKSGDGAAGRPPTVVIEDVAPLW